MCLRFMVLYQSKPTQSFMFLTQYLMLLNEYFNFIPRVTNYMYPLFLFKESFKIALKIKLERWGTKAKRMTTFTCMPLNSMK